MSLFGDNDYATTTAAPAAQPDAAEAKVTPAAAPAAATEAKYESVSAYHSAQRVHLANALTRGDCGDSAAPCLPPELVHTIAAYVPASRWTYWYRMTPGSAHSIVTHFQALPWHFDMESSEGDATPYRELLAEPQDCALLSPTDSADDFEARPDVRDIFSALHEHCDIYRRVHDGDTKPGTKQVDARYGEPLSVTQGPKQLTYAQLREREQRTKRFGAPIQAFGSLLQALVDTWHGTVYSRTRRRDTTRQEFLIVLDDGERHPTARATAAADAKTDDAAAAVVPGVGCAPSIAVPLAAAGAGAGAGAGSSSSSSTAKTTPPPRPRRLLIAGVSRGIVVRAWQDEPISWGGDGGGLFDGF